MKIQMFLLMGFALAVTACGEKERATSAGDSGIKQPAEEVQLMERTAPQDKVGTAAFVRHMHAHARQLERLTAALDEGDLTGAMTPAYWLSRHEGISPPVASWRPYMDAMREAAKAIERAPDLATARAAATQISDACQGCHGAAGIAINLTSP